MFPRPRDMKIHICERKKSMMTMKIDGVQGNE